MADTPKRLIGPVGLATAATAYYTVPAGVSTIVRNIHAFNTGASVVAFHLFLGNTSTASGYTALSLYTNFQIPAYTALDWSGFQVLSPDDVLYAQGGTANTLILTVSGIEVS